MDWFKIVSDYYRAGYYSNVDVRIFVDKDKIAKEDYKSITGESYI